MYSKLNDFGRLASITDSKKYTTCTSIPYPRTNTFNTYQSSLPCYSDREYFNSVSNIFPPFEQKDSQNHLHVRKDPKDPNSTNYYLEDLQDLETKENFEYKMNIKIHVSPDNIFVINDVKTSDSILDIKKKISEKQTMNHEDLHLSYNGKNLQDSKKLSDYDIKNNSILNLYKKLLPILDCRFNMREICKQCILLEDHLSQDRKRCHDCCIKHFLALEGLSEEAITLDKDEKYKKELESIPDKIRSIQKIWHQNPDKNSHLASQKLREIRKSFQEKVFNMIFDSNNSLSSCSSNSCKIK